MILLLSGLIFFVLNDNSGDCEDWTELPSHMKCVDVDGQCWLVSTNIVYIIHVKKNQKVIYNNE